MISHKPSSDKRNSKDKRIKTKIPAEVDADSDFIVFQFTEDGEIDLVTDKDPPPNQQRPKDRTHHRSKVQFVEFFFVSKFTCFY